MLIDKAQNIKSGTFIRVNLRGALDGITYLANGPLVLVDGDVAEILGQSMFPMPTAQGTIASQRKYVAVFHAMGGLRMLLGPEEIAKAFELLDPQGNAVEGAQ